MPPKRIKCNGNKKNNHEKMARDQIKIAEVSVEKKQKGEKKERLEN